MSAADEWIDLDTDGAALLDDVEGFLGTYVAFPSEHARIAVTLWACHSHLIAAATSTPRLALLSPEPGSGKTRVLEVLELLVPAPMSVLSASRRPSSAPSPRRDPRCCSTRLTASSVGAARTTATRT